MPLPAHPSPIAPLPRCPARGHFLLEILLALLILAVCVVPLLGTLNRLRRHDAQEPLQDAALRHAQDWLARHPIPPTQVQETELPPPCASLRWHPLSATPWETLPEWGVWRLEILAPDGHAILHFDRLAPLPPPPAQEAQP